MVFFRFWAVSVPMIVCGAFLLFLMSAYAADTPPKGLVLPPQLKADIARIEEFITASQPLVDFMDPETRIVQNIRTRPPAFDTSVINDDLFNAIKRVRSQIPVFIDTTTARRAAKKIDLNLDWVDAGNKRFIRPVSPSPYILNIFEPEPLNVTPPLSDRNTLYPKSVTPQLRQKIPTTAITQLNAMADQFSFLQEKLAQATHAHNNMRSLLIDMFNEGRFTEAHIQLAIRDGMSLQVAKEAYAYLEELNRLKMRPRSFGVEPVSRIAPSVSVVRPSPSSIFSQAASDANSLSVEPANLPPRRTLTWYQQTKLPPIEYANPFADPFNDPFVTRWGTKFYKQPQSDMPIVPRSMIESVPTKKWYDWMRFIKIKK